MATPMETRRRVEHVSESDFAQKVLHAGVPVLVDFYADWCGPCRRLAPVLEEIARETPDAKVVKVNVDEAQRLAVRYRIDSIPYLAVFRDGEIVAEHLGLADKQYLRSMLDR